MTREEVAAHVVYRSAKFIASILSTVALFPQAWKVIRSKTAEDVKSVSFGTFAMIMFINATFSVFGWINRDSFYSFSLVASGVAAAVIFFRALYLRWGSSALRKNLDAL